MESSGDGDRDAGRSRHASDERDPAPQDATLWSGFSHRVILSRNAQNQVLGVTA